MKFKKSSYSIAEKNVKILKDGKIKIQKGSKYPLEPFIAESVDKTICLPIDNIINQEPLASTKDMPDVELQMATMTDVISRPSFISSYLNNKMTQTVVAVTTKKVCDDLFNFENESIVGNLMRTSNLPSIYKRIKDTWIDINEKKFEIANVLFIPEILVYLDSDNGSILRYPYKVNLLVISEPNKKDIEETAEYKEKDLTRTDLIERVVAHVAEAAVKCNATNLVIAPFCHKWLSLDIYTTAERWSMMIKHPNICNSIEKITFAINGENLYIIFKNVIKNEDFVSSSLSI